MHQQQKHLGSSHGNTKKNSSLLIIVLKNSEKRDAAMLATIITNPIFEMGIKNHDDVDRWFKSNVDRQKTFKQQQRYFLILAYQKIDELKTRPKRVTNSKWRNLQAAITRGWTARIKSIIDVMELD